MRRSLHCWSAELNQRCNNTKSNSNLLPSKTFKKNIPPTPYGYLFRYPKKTPALFHCVLKNINSEIIWGSSLQSYRTIDEIWGVTPLVVVNISSSEHILSPPKFHQFNAYTGGFAIGLDSHRLVGKDDSDLGDLQRVHIQRLSLVKGVTRFATDNKHSSYHAHICNSCVVSFAIGASWTRLLQSVSKPPAKSHSNKKHAQLPWFLINLRQDMF